MRGRGLNDYATGSIWNRYGNVLAFEEINRLSREVLIKTKDIVQSLGYELIYADTDSVFIKRTESARDYNEVIDTLQRAYDKEKYKEMILDLQKQF